MAKLTPVIVGDINFNEQLAADNIVQAQAAVAVKLLNDLKDEFIIIGPYMQQKQPYKVIVLLPGNTNDENIKDVLSTLIKQVQRQATVR